MGILSIFIAALVPVLEVLIVTAVGAVLAIDRVGLLAPSARDSLNNIVFYVFNPPLVATNLAKTVTVKSLSQLWFMPVNILLTFIIGSALGLIVFKLFKVPPRLKGLIVGSCSAGNLGNILLIIVPAVCVESGSPFGESSVCEKYGMGYVSLSMAVGAIFIWTYVYNIARVSSNAITEEADEAGYKQIADSPDEASNLLSGNNTESLISAEDPPTTISRPEEPVETEKATWWKNILKAISKNVDLKKVFAPSTIGTIIGFAVGLITPLRKAFIGDSAPLRAIEASAVLLSDAAIPSATLILGGNLITGTQGGGLRFTVVIGIIVVRYVLLPAIGIGVIKGAIYSGLVGDDPLYQFILLLQYALPPAMSLGTITQLFGAGRSECSVIFLWTYIVASVALTIWIAIFIWIVS